MGIEPAASSRAGSIAGAAKMAASLHDAAVNSHFEVVRALVEVSCLTPSLLEIAA